MIWLALLGAVIVGLSLGLLGSGGSILTVPLLVYLVGQPEKVAIAGSLAVVGGIALAGAIPSALRGGVEWRSVGWFGVPGMLGTVLGAHLSRWIAGDVQLLLFAVVMLIAAWRMARPGSASEHAGAPRSRTWIVIDGLGVGLLTGLVGVGGGFMIVPALVLLGGLPMHRAIATSLWISVHRQPEHGVGQAGANGPLLRPARIPGDLHLGRKPVPPSLGLAHLVQYLLIRHVAGQGKSQRPLALILVRPEPLRSARRVDRALLGQGLHCGVRVACPAKGYLRLDQPPPKIRQIVAHGSSCHR